ncbi:metal ABC transporter permease [Deinococcus peraridilitoris]|uniref:metal ABC transporter permease n=1 Tax=Deinococcus peraridilitoris TaxID=432329 RepID=UPI0002DAC7B9|nr:metal ABC transporter permease [Deinococcus peraridilitoris]
MGSVALLNLWFVASFYKELKLSTFDPGLAAALGFAPGVLHYALMGLVSVTTVAAFDAVGAILVVAFMIVPGATAYLLTRRLPVMLLLSVLTGAGASVLGVQFALAVLFSPHAGAFTQSARRARQRGEFAVRLLVAHLAHHDGRPVDDAELLREFGWGKRFLTRIIGEARTAGLIVPEANGWTLTPAGAAHGGTPPFSPS